MLLIEEVEMVESVDDLKTSQSIEGHEFLNFEMHDAKIASPSKRILMNPYFQKKVSRKDKNVSVERKQGELMSMESERTVNKKKCLQLAPR